MKDFIKGVISIAVFIGVLIGVGVLMTWCGGMCFGLGAWPMYFVGGVCFAIAGSALLIFIIMVFVIVGDILDSIGE